MKTLMNFNKGQNQAPIKINCTKITSVYLQTEKLLFQFILLQFHKLHSSY